MGNETFAMRVKQERTKKGLSIDALAKALGINKSRVSMWELNGTIPRQDVFKKLCQFLGVPGDYLLGTDNVEISESHKRLLTLQRNLETLNEEELKDAEIMFTTLFKRKFGGINNESKAKT